jgi:predicted kinase
MSKRLILMQGAPGCGKSTMADILARHYMSENREVEIHSADRYWYEVVEPSKPDKYSWDTAMSGKNHVWNQKNVLGAMEAGVDVIIVDNTNTMRKEAAPYVVMAELFGYEVEAVRVDPGVDVCLARNSKRPSDRQVPADVVRRMHDRMETLLPLFDA